MASDGSVVFSTELDESGLKSALQGLGGKIATWTKAAGVALSAVGAGLGALAKKAFSYNSQMEDYQTNFAVLLGDEAKAMEHVAHLRERAAKTPFGMEDLAGASQTMLSFGLSAEKSSQTMEQLGDIALGDKSKFQMLTLAFSQISAAGKLAGNDLLQLVNAGFNPLNTIAEKTGTNLGDLKEVMSGGKGSKEFQKQMKAAQKEVAKMGDQASEGAKLLAQIGKDGYISAEMIGKAMEIETAPGGRFYNGMQKASQTMSGMISTLKDDADALVGEVFAPMTEQIGKTMIPMAQGYLQQLTGAFQSGGTKGLVKAVGSVMSDALEKGVTALPNMLTLAQGLLSSLGAAMKRNAKGFAKSLSSLISSAAKSITTMAPDFLKTGIAIMTALVQSMAQSMPELVPSLVDGFASLFVTLCENADDIIIAGVAIVKGLVSGILKALPRLFTGITDAFTALFTNTDEIADRASEILDEKFGSTLSAYEAFQNGLKTADETFQNSIADAEARKTLALELLGAYDALASKQVKSDKDMEDMEGLAEKIVDLYPQLREELDPTTKSFKKGTDAVRAHIDALAALAMSDAYAAYLKTLSEQYVALSIETKKAAGAASELKNQETAAADAASNVQKLYDALDEGGSPALVENIEALKTAFSGTEYEAGFQKMYDAVTGANDLLSSGVHDIDTVRQTIATQLLGILGAKQQEAGALHTAVMEADATVASMQTDLSNIEARIDAVKSEMKEMAGESKPGTQPAPDDGTAPQKPMTESAESDVAGAIDAINNGATGIANSAKDAVDGANKAAMTKTQQSSNVGYQLAAGVASGVNMGAPLLYSAINSMMQKAYQGARKFAQIASPSRLFANGIGAFLPSGAAMGVESNAWKLRKAVNDMIADSMPQEGFELGLNVRPGYTQGQTVATQMAPARGLGVGWARAAGSSDAFGAGGGSFQQVNNFNVPVQTPDEFAKTMRLYATYGMEGAI